MKLEFCFAFANRHNQNSPGSTCPKALTSLLLGWILNNEDLRERVCFMLCHLSPFHLKKIAKV